MPVPTAVHIRLENLSRLRETRVPPEIECAILSFSFFNPPTLLVPPLSNKRKNEKASIPPTLFQETFKAFFTIHASNTRRRKYFDIFQVCACLSLEEWNEK